MRSITDGPSAGNERFRATSQQVVDGRQILRVVNGDFERDLLRDAVVESLFTDRRAQPEQAGTRERRGWWGDPDFGSRLWLVWRRGRLDARAVSEARAYAEQALAWLVEDQIAASVTVDVTRLDAGLSVAVSVVRPSGEAAQYRFGPLWG